MRMVKTRQHGCGLNEILTEQSSVKPIDEETGEERGPVVTDGVLTAKELIDGGLASHASPVWFTPINSEVLSALKSLSDVTTTCFDVSSLQDT